WRGGARRPRRAGRGGRTAWMAGRWATSQGTASACRSPPSSAASARRRSSRRATSATRAPRAARSRASWAPMPLDAPVTSATRSRKSERRATAARSGARRVAGHEAQREPDERGDHARSQQTGVVGRQPQVVLPHADASERRERDVADLVRDLHGEVVARRRAVPELEGRAPPAERLQRHATGTAHEEPGLLDERQLHAAIRCPVAEEENVSRLLLHDAVEDLDERRRE